MPEPTARDLRAPRSREVDALEIADLRVVLDGRQVLQGLNLTAAPGRVTALLGPNGAGKTTTLRCVTGLVRPDAGTVRVLGQTPAEAAARGLIGVMPQETGAWSGVRPLELLRYLARLHAHPLPVNALAAELGLDDFAGTTYRRLSGGQKQLVNLAGALVGRPTLALLDEPTAGLDPHVRRRVWDLIARLRAAGTSVLLTTHHMDEVENLADEVAIMSHGHVLTHGPVDRVRGERSLEDVFLEVTAEEAPA